MMIERKLLEALDAVRPNSDDLEQPAFDELLDARQAVREDATVAETRKRIEQFDQAIGAAMDEVPVPADLAARLMARLNAAAEVAPAELAVAEASEPANVVELPARPSHEFSNSRRALLFGIGISVAAVLAVVLGMRLFAPVGPPLTMSEVNDLAVHWLHDLQDQPAGWLPMNEAPLDLPASEYVKVLPQGFRTVASVQDPSAEREQLADVDRVVAYDLQRRGRRATLFAFRAPVEALDSVPPRLSTPVTGGATIGLWQEGDVVYALVVQGGTAEYEQFIKTGDLG